MRAANGIFLDVYQFVDDPTFASNRRSLPSQTQMRCGDSGNFRSPVFTPQPHRLKHLRSRRDARLSQ